MNQKLVNRLPFVLIVLTTLIFANLQVNKRDSGKDICFNICGDARGYYAWLPAVFIYHDLHCSFFDTVELPDTTCGCKVAVPIQDYRYTVSGKVYDKYYPGASFMMLPVFTIAHFYTKWFTHYRPNGYSQLYFVIMGLSGIIYYFVGMLFFLKILRHLKLTVFRQSLCILLITFGTNLMYYAIDAPLYSHIYSFTLIAIFLFYLLLIKEQVTGIRITTLAFITGLIFIARPVNVTILLIVPFILQEQVRTIKHYFSTMPRRLLLLLPVLIMPFILFALYKVATGNFILYSYKQEGFDFLHPHIFDFLFQYNNGIIPYTPLLAMPLILLPLWYKSEYKYIVAGVVLTAFVTIYIHSSWWAPDYGFSFGARTMLDFTPLFGIVAGISLNDTRGKKLYFIITAYLLCTVLTLILYHQKSHGGFMNHYPITDYWAAIRNAINIK